MSRHLAAARGGTLVLVALSFLCTTSRAASGTLSFAAGGYTNHGNWSGNVVVSPASWKPGDTVTVDATLQQARSHLQALTAAGINADSFVMLVTAERTFDYAGHLHLPYDQYMSTLITPTGLPIEGGYQGAVTTRFGQSFSTPFDQFVKTPIAALGLAPDRGAVLLHVSGQLAANLPPGVYRLRIDIGVAQGNNNYTLNGGTFAYQSTFYGTEPMSFVYSPLIPADGVTVSGASVSGSTIQPRVPWVLLYNYNSNGYMGVIAEEDKPYFALSPRNMIQDDVILPLLGSNGKPTSYNLEPQMIANSKDPTIDIPWDYSAGQISVAVTGPDGKTTSLGQYPFVRQNGSGPTTGKPALTAWIPPAYGQYTVTATGYFQDIYGNQYQGGGTFHFWIANRLTLATATFQGMPYPIGSTYGKDIAFAPPAPANVTVTASLFPNSDPTRPITMNCSGVATAGGVFGALQGNKSLVLSVPGEYSAHIVATYTDRGGAMWVASMRHAGVVYDPNGPIVARGKKLLLPDGTYGARGDTHDEGYIDPKNYNEHLIHLNYPYNPGDVLLIASEGQGANKIIPTMTYETTTNFTRDDAGLNGIGTSNLKLNTSNGYSPHMFPEYINDWEYYYGSAARPGFVSRFVVGETLIRGPYWPVSPNAFGNQINASSNGDLPGDIYRLMGAVVVRKPGAAPAYAGYIASGFLLPRGTNDNRVVAAGSEDLTASTGQKGKVFLVGPRPGMTYPVGTTFAAAFQIDPILPVNITFKMTYPDARTVQTSGVGSTMGSFAGPNTFLLDIPGAYQYSIDANWNGNPAVMPGLPPSGGEIYVLEAKPPANAPGLQFTVADGTTFDPVAGIHITGTSTGSSVHFTAVMPGAVLDSGILPVTNGKFDYYFNPAFLNSKAQTYDIANRTTGQPQIGDVVHMSFFSAETTPDGQVYHSFVRAVVRGTTVRIAK